LPATDWIVFFGLWLRRPMTLAAANPSGRTLADTLGRHVELERAGHVLELGGGTGSLTRGLLRQGCPPQRLVVVECEARLVELLRENLPGVRVLAGDAAELKPLLAQHGIHRLASVVSSLPIKWFPPPLQAAIVEQCFDLLGTGGRLLQVTNALSSPLPREALRIHGEEIERIWRNILPAQIWAYRRQDG
jgi:phosphatidylethanolamine/phosphatidyl-N-methylethanolamine N-methyltransferase